jgi:hypothetical protein
VTRYRLRFLLQEIDLPQGETLIGRSASCQVTIEDPLVSRQHGRIHIQAALATFEDLGSRNGSMVNGRAVTGTVQVRDGDRIRIGTQDLVLCTAGVPARRDGTPGTRPTGFMCHCASCAQPYPAELALCPRCGSTDRLDDDTISGVVGEAQRNWSLDLLVEVLERAASLQRWDDVERVLRRAKPHVDERLAAGQRIPREQLDSLAGAASRLAEVRGKAEWGRWLLTLHAAVGSIPSPAISQRLSTLPPAERQLLAPAVDEIVESVRASGGPDSEDQAGFDQVQSLSGTPVGGEPG